jgi:hypothetical protein
MKYWSYVALACAGSFLILLWLMMQIHYRIGRTHLKILLFSIPIRRIPLTDIESISKRPPRFAENWPNTLRSSHRLLAIRRTRGLCKNLVITPKNRYVFMADLQHAVRRAQGKISDHPSLKAEMQESDNNGDSD